MDDMALAFENSLGENQDASDHRIVRGREADLDVRLQKINVKKGFFSHDLQ